MTALPRSLRLGALLVGALLALVVLWPASGGAHPERVTKFPSPQPGSVPAARSGGPVIVVCQRDSLSRLKRIYGKNRRALRPRLQALRRCHFRSIQSAVNAAKTGDRILLLPGVYTEPASRKVPVGSFGQPPCAADYVATEGFTNTAPPPAGPASNDPPLRATPRTTGSSASRPSMASTRTSRPTTTATPGCTRAPTPRAAASTPTPTAPARRAPRPPIRAPGAGPAPRSCATSTPTTTSSATP